MPQTEPLPRYWDYEGFKAATQLLEDIMGAKEGERVVITNDSTGDDRVSQLVAAAAHRIGAIPVEIRYPTSPAAVMDPPEPVADALKAADVWIELNRSYILDTRTQRDAAAAGVRYMCLTGMDVDTLVRTIGMVDLDAVIALGEILAELTNQSEVVEVTCGNGSNLRAENRGRRAAVEGRGTGPGAVLMLSGQTNWVPVEETIEGRAVFDGSVWPPDSVGVLFAPIALDFERGFVRQVTGQWQASRFEEWLRGFNDDSMFRFSHFSYGYNPGVLRPSGRVVEDERVFGCLDIGLGSQTAPLVDDPVDAPCHTDGTILKPTIRLDGEPIEENGRYVHPELVKACRVLGAPGY